MARALFHEAGKYSLTRMIQFPPRLLPRARMNGSRISSGGKAGTDQRTDKTSGRSINRSLEHVCQNPATPSQSQSFLALSGVRNARSWCYQSQLSKHQSFQWCSYEVGLVNANGIGEVSTREDSNKVRCYVLIDRWLLGLCLWLGVTAHWCERTWVLTISRRTSVRIWFQERSERVHVALLGNDETVFLASFTRSVVPRDLILHRNYPSEDRIAP